MPMTWEVNPAPLPYGPLSDVVVPETYEDIAMQLGMLATVADSDYRHMEADRLLLLALQLKAKPTEDDVHDVITAYNKVGKYYE